MGCCVSTNTPPRHPKTPRISDSKSAAPRHPILEEEAVKEVLSETATVPRQNLPIIKSEPSLPEFNSTAAHDKWIQNGVARHKPPTPFSNDDPSEVSEICSNLSESASISAVVTDNGEANGEARERRQRSPARSTSRQHSGEIKRQKSVGKSPGRRTEISPNRSGSGNGRRKDSGEISGRRSRSPMKLTETAAAAHTGLGRTQSGRKTGRAPGPERIRKAEEWALTGKESLENPLVSLECFIFL